MEQPQQQYCVEWLKDRPVKNRGLAWLVPRPEISIINAKLEFFKLDDKRRADFNNKFDAWIDGDKPNKNWYHPWDEKGYENVWVFKNQHDRFFAFMCHPDEANPRFAMCVLTSHTMKFSFEADRQLKQLMQDLSQDEDILEAARAVDDECYKIIPFKKGGKRKR